MRLAKINLNDHVLVKLTDSGIKVLNEYYGVFLETRNDMVESHRSKDMPGYFTFQVWKLMLIFSESIRSKNPPLFMEAFIEVEK